MLAVPLAPCYFGLLLSSFVAVDQPWTVDDDGRYIIVGRCLKGVGRSRSTRGVDVSLTGACVLWFVFRNSLGGRSLTVAR